MAVRPVTRVAFSALGVGVQRCLQRGAVPVGPVSHPCNPIRRCRRRPVAYMYILILYVYMYIICVCMCLCAHVCVYIIYV